MNTKIEIENGKVKIILTPENAFEEDALRNASNNQNETYISEDTISGDLELIITSKPKK